MPSWENIHVHPEMLQLFYSATICGVWRFCLVCWGGNTEKNRINSIIKKAERVVGESLSSFDSTIYHCLLQSKLDFI